MKKMFTLIATVMFVSGAFAQYRNDNNKTYERSRDVAYNDNRAFNDKDYRNNRGRDGDRWRNAAWERDMQIARINREYDRKIEAVKHDWFMNRYKKERIICSLQDRRRDEIKMTYESFNRACNSFDHDYHGRH